MGSTTKTLPILLALLALGGVGSLYVVLRSDRAELGGRNQAVAHPTLAKEEDAQKPLLEEPLSLSAPSPSSETAHTTVLWPLRVELDLVQPGYIPHQEGTVPVGTGKTARLTGRLTGTRDEPVRGEVVFIKGVNVGRVLRCDSGGAFGANDLYPGLGVVEVRGDAIPGARREVRMRRGQEVILNIGFGRLASATGRVQDRKGKGIEGARVTFDGKVYQTGTEGELYVPAVAGGQVLVEIEKVGFASYQELVWIQAGASNTNKDRLSFTLDEEVSLEVSLRGNVGGPGPATLILLPGQHGYRATSVDAYRNARFPYHTINPIELWPNSPLRIAGLPPRQVVKLYVFRPGAEPKMKVVNLSSREQSVQIELKAAPMIVGRVTLDGEPVGGAQIRMEATDRPRATLSFFKEASYYLETAIIPEIPPAVEETKSQPNGRFFLSSWAKDSSPRYVEARGPEGKTWAGTLLRAGTKTCELQLKEMDEGDGELELEFPGRFQGLPVELHLNGTPHDPRVLKPSETMQVEGIPSGRWRIRITWHGQPVYENGELEVEGRLARVVQLPQECIQGQDEESWKRAGQIYPGT